VLACEDDNHVRHFRASYPPFIFLGSPAPTAQADPASSK
jgi:hypothetical protein